MRVRGTRVGGTRVGGVVVAGEVVETEAVSFRDDPFDGDALGSWWSEYRPDLLDSPVTVASGYALLELDVGGAAGSHWYGDGMGIDRIGYLMYQLVSGDFAIAMELQVFDLAGTGLPPATNDARLAGLAAHDPYRPPG